MVDVSAISFIFDAILLSSILVGILAWLSIRFYARVGLLDQPNSAPHKHHSVLLPWAGGLALFSGLLSLRMAHGNTQRSKCCSSFHCRERGILFGLWDDFKGISPSLKILGQVLAVAVLIALGVSIRVFESPNFSWLLTGP